MRRRLILAPTIAPITDKTMQPLSKITNIKFGWLENDTLISKNIINALQIMGVYQILFGCVLQIIKQAAVTNIT